MKQLTYNLTDHACNKCGGRILREKAAGLGISGYDYYVCSCCGLGGSGMITPPTCYCNMKWRGSDVSNYRCVNVKELSKAPWLKDACAHSGYDIDSGQTIGLVCRNAEKTAEDSWHQAHGYSKGND